MEITGTIKVIKPIQQVSSTFSKREFIIETEEQYVQTISLELHGDRVDIIDSFAEGEKITVSINLAGKEWKSPQGEIKYFNSIKAWKIQKTERHEPEFGYKPPAETKTNPIEATSDFNEEEESDLPF